MTPPGLAAWTINYGTIPADANPGRLHSVSRPDPANGTATTTVTYHVPLSGAGAPYAMGPSDVAAWGQHDDPTDATAIFAPDEVPSTDPPTDYSRATIYYSDASGNQVNTAEPGGRISTTEYDSHNNVVRELSATNRTDALAAGSGSAGESTLLDTQSSYSADGINLLSTLGPQHMMKLKDGTQVLGRTQTTLVYDEGSPGGTAVQHLLTTKTVATDQGKDSQTTTYHYDGESGLGWTLGQPTSTTVDASPGGLNLATTTLYDPTTGAVTETRTPASPGGGDAHSSQTIYYTTAANTADPTCGNQPDWAGEVCQTQRASQPGTVGLLSIPVTTYTYDLWGDTATQADTAGSATRTTTNGYDTAGRLTSTAITSSSGAPLPTTTYSYDPSTGLRTQQQSSDGRTITTSYDSLGRTTSYVDADGNTSTTTYDIDGRPRAESDGKGTRTFAYNTAGDPVTLQDSAAGTFTASYNADGAPVTEEYPDGLLASYTYDETGTPTDVNYDKVTDCSINCTWYDDRVTPSVQGQWLSEQSTLGTRSYGYDGAGRLSTIQDTPTGQSCTTRAYSYDADSNRVAETTTPGFQSTCEATGGTTATHSYDAADRLTDSGTSYDEWGNTLTLPAADAGGSTLTSTYYAGDEVHTESQNGETITYSLDPADRSRERVYAGNKTGGTIDHYSDTTDDPAWTDNGDGTWTRYIAGLDGELAGTENSSGLVTLQIPDLHGDIIGTVSDTPTGAPSFAQNSDEFGDPYTWRTPQRYDWLGMDKRTTALPSGVIDMGAREYVPAIGRFEQTDPVSGGSANAYDYTNQDPVDGLDLGGTLSLSPNSSDICSGGVQDLTLCISMYWNGGFYHGRQVVQLKYYKVRLKGDKHRLRNFSHGQFAAVVVGRRVINSYLDARQTWTWGSHGVPILWGLYTFTPWWAGSEVYVGAGFGEQCGFASVRSSGRTLQDQNCQGSFQLSP